MTPEKHVQAAGSTSLCSPRQSEGKKGQYLIKEWTRVELRGIPSVYQTPEAQERGQRRSKGWQCRRGSGYARMSQTRAAATLSRGGLPFPASGPSHSHAAPAPPWAPPASGTATTGLGSETDNFLLPDAQPGSNSPSTDEAARSRVAPSSAPRSCRFCRKQNARIHGVRGNSRDIWRARVLAPSGVQLFLLSVLQTLAIFHRLRT